MTVKKIAILGTRGIPARYGGFETFAEEISTRLVAHGLEVSVFCRRPFGRNKSKDQNQLEEYRGVKLRYVPTLMHKYLETPLHALISFLLFKRGECDAALLCNAANSPFAWILGLKGIPVIINVDGIERRRSKWNAIGKLWYRLGEWCSVKYGTVVVADAKVIAKYYRKTYGAKPRVIAYGADPVVHPSGATLEKFGLTSKAYLLYVSRLEPENNARGVIEAYNNLDTKMPLVIVGDAPYAKEYIAELKRLAKPEVVFTGYQFGAAYQELRSHCYLYIQATEVGGTHPALVEAMAYGNCVLANATPENLEVLGGAGEYYWRNDFLDLHSKLQILLKDPQRVRQLSESARKRSEQRYSWEQITRQYSDVFI